MEREDAVMAGVAKEDKTKPSMRQLFGIYLKIGRKRVALSIFCGIMIFLAITGLVMIVFTYRFNTFQNQEINWLNDGHISVSSNRYDYGYFAFSDNFFGSLTEDFASYVNNVVPEIQIVNTTVAVSAQLYTYNPPPPDPWLNHEIMTFDTKGYEALSKCLVEGKLPQNASELLIYSPNNSSDLYVNDTVTLYSFEVRDPEREYMNFTIVGTVDNIHEGFQNESLSADIFDWNFETGKGWFYGNYRNYFFFTNSSMLNEILNDYNFYNGIVTYLADFVYDNSGIRLNKMSDYILAIPTYEDLPYSDFIEQYVIVCPDLKEVYLQFNQLWIVETVKILSLNAPLLFIIGLLSIITLNIGSKELGSTFRRMKLYGLSYNNIRVMVLLENFIFTFLSFVIGTLLGFLFSYLFTKNLESQPSNYYIDFIKEPLLYITIITITLGFFLLSFYIQNSIAKKTTRTTSEEFKKQRSKIRTIFSTNEFRLFVIALVFSIVSITFFLVYKYTGEEGILASNLSYLTIFYFMVSCSAALLITFAFLLIARITTMFWLFVSNKLWPNRLNLFTLAIKQMVVNKNIYQIAILGTLTFGLVILPGMAMETSIPVHLDSEINFNMGGSTLVVLDWADTEGEKDIILNNITEIANYTEVTLYLLKDSNVELRFPKAFRAYMLALESPTAFASIIDPEILDGSKCTIDDILALENDSNVLFDRKYVSRNRLKPGDNQSMISFTRQDDTLSYVNSFNYFPLCPLPKKDLFQYYIDAFAIIGNDNTIRDIERAIEFSSDIYSDHIKLLKPVNETIIPSIQEKLLEHNIIAITKEELSETIYMNIDPFPRNNLLMFAILAAFTLLFVGYFTGISIFEERGRIIESLYRVGSVRGQILAAFTFEHLLINLIPMIVSVLASLPLLSYVAISIFGVQEIY
ncbi:MAG: ABC transporter permease [Candidatus Heimdallarchaeota archaeon]